MQRCERAELLGNQQRRVVRQHDAARTYSDAVGTRSDVGERDRGRRARDARQVVMLGHPIAPVPKGLDMLRKVEGITQRLARVATLDDRS